MRPAFVATAFSGEGAALAGGRWNEPGLRVVYTSSSVSLALLEALVHIERGGPLPAMALFTIDIPESVSLQSITPADVPGFPAMSETETRSLGSAWIRSARSVGLVVPSVIVPLEANVLLNPAHPAFSELDVGGPAAFTPDARLRG
ncbi:MAG: RES family NAD+ phosphorylase [Dehalococcoidia bacterium]